MAQAMIDNLREEYPCTFCKKICKSTAGLMAHMNRIHPLDSPSGLTCYTCNKLFTNRDLKENHYKTVKHQLECKKLKQMEEVEKTTSEAETKQYRKNLFEITHFRAPEYRPRSWTSEETKKIPLESLGTLQDPRMKKQKMPASFQDTEKMAKKTQKPNELPECITKQDAKEDHNLEEDHKSGEDLIPTLEGVIIHVTDSELNLFPDIQEDPKEEPIKEDCTNIKENRKVYLNNNWQVKDSIGSPAFQGIIEEDPNIDWLTFISENINY